MTASRSHLLSMAVNFAAMSHEMLPAYPPLPCLQWGIVAHPQRPKPLFPSGLFEGKLFIMHGLWV
jgi:hypothetical protein